MLGLLADNPTDRERLEKGIRALRRPVPLVPALPSAEGRTPAADVSGAGIGQREAGAPRTVTFAEALRYWIRLGFISFGGPAGQIAIMQRDLVERRKWISQTRFVHALGYCMLLPGPEAQQLAIYIGWLLHGTWGGIVAGAFFVLPSVFILWGLSALYALYGELPAVAGAFAGLKPVVLALVAVAVAADWSAVASSALAGASFSRRVPRHPVPARSLSVDHPRRRDRGVRVRTNLARSVRRSRSGPAESEESDPASEQSHSQDRDRAIVAADREDRTGRTRPLAPALSRAGLAAGLVEHAGAPVPFLHAGGARDFRGSVRRARLRDAGGGAVVSLDHSAQAIDGLGLAEATPGPLIMVLQFVGFMTGWNHPEGLNRLAAASLGAAVTPGSPSFPVFSTSSWALPTSRASGGAGASRRRCPESRPRSSA